MATTTTNNRARGHSPANVNTRGTLMNGAILSIPVLLVALALNWHESRQLRAAYDRDRLLRELRAEIMQQPIVSFRSLVGSVTAAQGEEYRIPWDTNKFIECPAGTGKTFLVSKETGQSFETNSFAVSTRIGQSRNTWSYGTLYIEDVNGRQVVRPVPVGRYVHEARILYKQCSHPRMGRLYEKKERAVGPEVIITGVMGWSGAAKLAKVVDRAQAKQTKAAGPTNTGR